MIILNRIVVVFIFYLFLSVLELASGSRIGAEGSSSNIWSRPLQFFSPPNLKILPPPTDISSSEGGVARGISNLKKTSSILQSLFKTHTKCSELGSFAIANECNKYLQCKEIGHSQISTYCPSGMLYDHFQRKCMAASLAKCRGVCKYDGELHADPTDPSGYLKCQYGVPKPEKCLPGSTFNNLSTKCKGIADEKDSNSEEDEEEER